jgi:hypothetical protein
MERVVAWPGPTDPGYVNLHWTVPDAPDGTPDKRPRGRAFKGPDDFMSMAQWLTTKPSVAKDIYYCLSVQHHSGKEYDGHLTAARGAQFALKLKALWIDIDVKKGKGYATLREALTALQDFIRDASLPGPTALVRSGGGLHVYWISDRALTLAEWTPYAQGLRAEIDRLGLKCDAGLTTDAARILRVPGTFNRKIANQPRPVVLSPMGSDYDFSSPAFARLKTVRPIVTAAVTSAKPIYDLSNFHGVPKCMAGLNPNEETLADGIHEDRPLDPGPVFQNCPHFQEAVKTHGADYPQGLWMQDVLASTWFEDGVRWAHYMSKGHAAYAKPDTDAMYQRKVKDRKDRNLGWPSCAAFANAGCNSCAGCPYNGKIRSPLNFASRIEPSAQAPVTEVISPGTNLAVAQIRAMYMAGANEEAVFSALNQCYSVVRYGSQVLIASIADGGVLFMEPPDFHKMFGNVRYFDGKRSVEVSRLWWKWEERRQCLGRGVIFEPGGPLEVADDMLNLWRGFGIEPKQGDWSLMRNHIQDVVCSGRQSDFDYLLKWMAYAVQHPNEPIGVAVAFRGAQGTGKGVVARTFGKIFGKHFAHIANGDQLTGRFNASLATSCAIFLDEALWAGDRKGEGVLKALITEPRLQLEAKFKDPIMVDNRLRIMVASNNEWMVPAGVGDRRWFILDVANTYAGTAHKNYWDALYAEIDHGGAAAMFYDLLAMDLSGFDVRAVPHTAAKALQQIHSLHGTEAWLHHILQEGEIGSKRWENNGLAVSKDDAYNCYEDFSKRQRDYRPETRAIWAKKARAALGLCLGDTRSGRERVRSFQFKPLADCRRQFATHIGAPNIEWDPENDATQNCEDADQATASIAPLDIPPLRREPANNPDDIEWESVED